MTGDTDEGRWILSKQRIELESNSKSDLGSLFFVNVVPEGVVEGERVVDIPAGCQRPLDRLAVGDSRYVSWMTDLLLRISQVCNPMDSLNISLICHPAYQRFDPGQNGPEHSRMG